MTFIYPGSETYLSAFIESLNNQDTNDFDLLIFNDGMNNPEFYIGKYKRMYRIIDCCKSIVENRLFALFYCKKHNYTSIIFGDSDDFFDRNRVSKINEKLKTIDIVVNDLTVVSKDGLTLIENYFSQRLTNLQIIDYSDIEEKNFLGFSNTAINTNIFDDSFFEVKNVIAVDWYIFSVLLKNGATALFCNETISYYRQHENNIAGLDGKKSQEYIAQVRNKHFDALNLPPKSSFKKIESANLFWWE